MGKYKRPRQKYHHSVLKNKPKTEDIEDFKIKNTSPLLLQPSNNLFAGLNIKVDDLQTNLLDDDVRSVKSFKSVKSETQDKTLSKKDKRMIRKQMLLKKIDLVNQMRKEKSKKSKANNSIIGDTKILLDALPSLDSLLKTHSNVKNKQGKKKAVEKASKRQKQSALNVKLFTKIMKNKEFKKNPFEAISEHINAVVNLEKSKLKK